MDHYPGNAQGMEITLNSVKYFIKVGSHCTNFLLIEWYY